MDGADVEGGSPVNRGIVKISGVWLLGASMLAGCAGDQMPVGPETGRITGGWGCRLFNDFTDLKSASKAKDVRRVAHMTGITGAAPTCHFIKGLRYTADVTLTNYARVTIEFPDGTTRPLWVGKDQLGG